MRGCCGGRRNKSKETRKQRTDGSLRKVDSKKNEAAANAVGSAVSGLAGGQPVSRSKPDIDNGSIKWIKKQRYSDVWYRIFYDFETQQYFQMSERNDSCRFVQNEGGIFRPFLGSRIEFTNEEKKKLKAFPYPVFEPNATFCSSKDTQGFEDVVGALRSAYQSPDCSERRLANTTNQHLTATELYQQLTSDGIQEGRFKLHLDEGTQSLMILEEGQGPKIIDLKEFNVGYSSTTEAEAEAIEHFKCRTSYTRGGATESTLSTQVAVRGMAFRSHQIQRPDGSNKCYVAVDDSEGKPYVACCWPDVSTETSFESKEKDFKSNVTNALSAMTNSLNEGETLAIAVPNAFLPTNADLRQQFINAFQKTVNEFLVENYSVNIVVAARRWESAPKNCGFIPNQDTFATSDPKIVPMVACDPKAPVGNGFFGNRGFSGAEEKFAREFVGFVAGLRIFELLKFQKRI